MIALIIICTIVIIGMGWVSIVCYTGPGSIISDFIVTICTLLVVAGLYGIIAMSGIEATANKHIDSSFIVDTECKLVETSHLNDVESIKYRCINRWVNDFGRDTVDIKYVMDVAGDYYPVTDTIHISP
jgi:hypothetical protein